MILFPSRSPDRWNRSATGRPRGQWRAIGFLVFASWLAVQSDGQLHAQITDHGPIVADVESKFSHIRVRQNGGVATMLFVRDTGQEVVETIVNLDRPDALQSGYTRAMFLSYIFQERPTRVLLVGLGGGAMVHFLRRYDPDVIVDVVEIDPEVIAIAKQFFQVQEDAHLRIIAADAADYLETTNERYDVIYVDAFQKPSANTDSTGVPFELKAARFYKNCRGATTRDGVLMFNVNDHAGLREDLAAIRAALRDIYVVRVAESSNYVVAAPNAGSLLSKARFLRQTEKLDARFRATFSFAKTVSTVFVPKPR